MSDSTPDSPKSGPNDTGGVDWDNGVENPPAEPLRASDHVSSPEAASQSTEPVDTTDDSVAPESEPSVSVPEAPASGNALPDELAPESPSTPSLAETTVVPPVNSAYDSVPTAPSPGWAAEPPVVAPVPATTPEPAAPPVTPASATPASALAAEDRSSTPVVPAAAGIAAAGGAIAAPDPAVAVPAAPTYSQPVTPIYVSAPLPPKKKSNRGVGVLIALVGTVIFAIVYAAVIAFIGALDTPANEFFTQFGRYLGTSSFFVPIVFFFVAMVILIEIVNRASWWVYIIGGFLVAVVVYFAFFAGALLHSAGSLTSDEVSRFLGTLWLNPFAIAGGVVAREVSIWIGAWLAVRGRRLKAKNAEAQAEYDRNLAAGPQTGYVATTPETGVPTAV